MVNKENLGVGCVEISPAAVKYVNQALKNRRLSYGPFIKRFEREFASAHDSQFAVMVNSGTSALRIAVAALKELGNWQDRDEVIIPVHLFGQSADMQPIMKLAEKHKLKVIEDSCESMYVTYRGKKVGSMSDI